MQTVNTVVIDTLLADESVIELYDRYCHAAIAAGIEPQSLQAIALQISSGDLGGFSVRDSVASVLEAMAWNHETSWAEKMQLAGGELVPGQGNWGSAHAA